MILNECIEGDYYEFGVYRGQTLVSFYVALRTVAQKRLLRTDKLNEPASYRSRATIKDEMIFHAFDSFEGLPQLTLEDKKSADFSVGQYSAAAEVMLKFADKFDMPRGRIELHKGWFSETCNAVYSQTKNLKTAALIWLDCDLYSSARDALNIFEYILQDGTVIVIDDWFCFKGHPDRGVQKAWKEFLQLDQISQNYIFTEYKLDSWARKSFICNAK